MRSSECAHELAMSQQDTDRIERARVDDLDQSACRKQVHVDEVTSESTYAVGRSHDSSAWRCQCDVVQTPSRCAQRNHQRELANSGGLQPPPSSQAALLPNQKQNLCPRALPCCAQRDAQVACQRLNTQMQHHRFSTGTRSFQYSTDSSYFLLV